MPHSHPTPKTKKTPLRLGVCSDTHYWPGCETRFGSDGNQLQPWSESIHAALLQELRAAGLDMVIHLGDFTCGGGSFEMPPAAFESVLHHTISDFQALPGQFYGLPGNHDAPFGEGGWAAAEQWLGLGAGLGQTVDVPGARLVFLHTHGHPQSDIEANLPGDPTKGWVSEAELARLDEAVATSDRPVLLFSHQLLYPWSAQQAEAWIDWYGIAKQTAVLEILAQYGTVRAVFQGHAHRLDVQEVSLGGRACTFIVAPAVICYPLGWLLLELFPDRVRVTLKTLPLPDLRQKSLSSGEGQAWRQGLTEWAQFEVELG